eukprot:3505319-Pyramimonas_sp.AAC.1
MARPRAVSSPLRAVCARPAQGPMKKGPTVKGMKLVITHAAKPPLRSRTSRVSRPPDASPKA